MKHPESRYWGPFRQEWYSICSIHYTGESDCDMCNTGMWHNVYSNKISHWFHDNHYNLWFRFVNRRWLRRPMFMDKHKK